MESVCFKVLEIDNWMDVMRDYERRYNDTVSRHDKIDILCDCYRWACTNYDARQKFKRETNRIPAHLEYVKRHGTDVQITDLTRSFRKIYEIKIQQ